MVNLAEYKLFKEALSQSEKTRNALVEKAQSLARSRKLAADKTFARISNESGIIPVSDAAHAAAEKRFRLGNPPGKSSDSIGDELNWELLLVSVPDEADLHIVTKDSDFGSKLNPTEPKSFLSDEWKAAGKGKLHLHEQISQFFKSNYPDEDFSLEIEKREAIDALVGSGNFASTHAGIALLKPYVPFLSDQEAEEVIQGALSNSQVAWIVSDNDVESFFKRMLQEHGNEISDRLSDRLKEALGLETEASMEEDKARV